MLKLWTLRLLLHCGGLKDFSAASRIGANVQTLLCLPADAFDGLAAPAVRSGLERMLATLERRGVSVPHDTVIARNTRALADQLGLNEVEHDIVHVTVLQRLCADFDGALDH